MKDIYNWIRTIAINLSRRLTFQKNFSMVLLTSSELKDVHCEFDRSDLRMDMNTTLGLKINLV